MTKSSPEARAQSRARYAANREKERARSLASYYANREQKLAAQAKWRAANPGRHRRWMYGLTAEAIEQMIADQGGGCAICSTPEPGGGKGWHVDHDHKCCPTGKTCGKCVRGLLCNRCNKALGLMGDDPERLRAAALYLERQTIN